VPESDYETRGFLGNVVFACGVIESARQLLIYYSAVDEHIALATVDVDTLFSSLLYGLGGHNAYRCATEIAGYFAVCSLVAMIDETNGHC